MDETVKKNIFTPFFTTKGAMAKDNRNIKGSGLGLAVSHRIIDQHGGTISVESDPGKGAEFTVTLPVLNTALETPRAVPDIPAERKALVSPFLKIFVVDDEPDLAALLTHYLSRKHSEHTRFALNPEEALQSIRKEPVDVVFCDIRMPGMRGDEFWEILRKTNPEIRIIFMTGELEASSDAMVKSGAAGFIRKPYSFHEIDSVLASLK
jgi:CheY-like chemotaxis protein